MTDPTATAPTMTLISTGSRLGADLTAAMDDDPVLDRLATWLAEVSAEAALRHSPAVEPPSAETAPT